MLGRWPQAFLTVPDPAGYLWPTTMTTRAVPTREDQPGAQVRRARVVQQGHLPALVQGHAADAALRGEDRQLYTQQKFGGFCHLYIGQEAILAGMITAIKPTDRIITGYRDHAHPLVLGIEPKYVMAELFGRTTAPARARAGSMHFFDKERNLFGGHGIVGGQIGLGAASPSPTNTAATTA
jgi:hypothetical protein